MSQNISYYNQTNHVQSIIKDEGYIQNLIQNFMLPSTSFRRTLINQCKRALFFTSVPFYWLIFFIYLLNWFDMSYFIMVNVASVVLSYYGMGWGLLDSLMGTVQ